MRRRFLAIRDKPQGRGCSNTPSRAKSNRDKTKKFSETMSNLVLRGADISIVI